MRETRTGIVPHLRARELNGDKVFSVSILVGLYYPSLSPNRGISRGGFRIGSPLPSVLLSLVMAEHFIGWFVVACGGESF
jgi:hypothetical protein